MSLLDRYLLRVFVRVFVLTTAGVVMLGMLFRTFEEFGRIPDGSPGAGVFGKYLALLVPGYLVLAFPLGVLVATLVTLGLASRHGELVAVQALGGSLRRYTAGFLLLGVLVSGAGYVLAEQVVPWAARKATRVRESEVRGHEASLSLIGKSFWMRADGGQLVRFTVAARDRIFDVSIFEFGDDGQLVRRIEAEEGRWVVDRWHLDGGRIYALDGETPEITRSPGMELPGLEPPERIDAERLRPEQMTRRELDRYVRRLESAGFDGNRGRVSLAGKLAQPFMNLAMALIATGLALRFRAAGGMKAAGLCVVVALGYWVLQSTGLSLGYSGRLAASLSAWLAPVTVGACGGVLWFFAER